METMIKTNTLSDVVITQAGLKDIPAIWQLYYNGWMATCPNEDLGISDYDVHAVLQAKKPIFLPWLARIITQPSPEGSVLVAKQNNQVIGMVIAKTKNGEALVSGMYIALEAQGIGIGNELLKQAIDMFENNNVYLWVATYNTAAQGFYGHHGFEFVSNKVHTFPGDPVPFYKMIYIKNGVNEDEKY